MPKIFTSETQKIGEIGENIAVRFLVKHNFSILERNYTKKWGEIDIIAEKSSKLYFIEVKSVTRETFKNIDTFKKPTDTTVIRETSDHYRPEENMHPWKLKRLSRVIQTYLMSNREKEDLDWQLDLLIVYLDIKNKKAKVKTISDVVL